MTTVSQQQQQTPLSYIAQHITPFYPQHGLPANGGMLQLPYGHRPHIDPSSAHTTPVTVGHQQATLGGSYGQVIGKASTVSAVLLLVLLLVTTVDKN